MRQTVAGVLGYARAPRVAYRADMWEVSGFLTKMLLFFSDQLDTIHTITQPLGMSSRSLHSFRIVSIVG